MCVKRSTFSIIVYCLSVIFDSVIPEELYLIVLLQEKLQLFGFG